MPESFSTPSLSSTAQNSPNLASGRSQGSLRAGHHSRPRCSPNSRRAGKQNTAQDVHTFFSYPDKFPFSQQHETNLMIEVVSYSDTTSKTVMRKHLANKHLVTWVQGCDQLNISISSSGKMKKNIEDYWQQTRSQGSLESANGKPDQPRTEFSPEAFVDAIMEFIVANDQVCLNCLQNVA